MPVVHTLVSIRDGLTHQDALSEIAAISADGRYVVFISQATNLADDPDTPQDESGDANGVVRDIFRKNLETGTIELVSSTAAGAQANFGTFNPSISGDGRFVAFESFSSEGLPQGILVKDMQTGALIVASSAANGTPTAFASTLPAISDDGKYVTFMTAGDFGIPGDVVPSFDIFRKQIRDDNGALIQNGELIRVSQVAVTNNTNGGAGAPAISADGRFITYELFTTAITPEDDNGAYDVVLYDAVLDTTTLVSRSLDGTVGNAQSFDPRITPDGRYVLFASDATDLVAGDSTTFSRDVFVWDRLNPTAPPRLVSTNAAGERANATDGNTRPGAISPDGRYVAFISSATNLAPEETNANSPDIFVKDLLTGRVAVVNVDPAGNPVIGFTAPVGTLHGPLGPRMEFTADGRSLLFDFSASLVASDVGGNRDVYLTDIASLFPPVVTLAIDRAAADEGQSFTLTVSRADEDLTQATTVTYTITGIAAEDIDVPLTGTITIPADATSATLAIATVQDTLDESDERFTVTISNPVNGAIDPARASVTGTIRDDDATIFVSVFAGQVEEGDTLFVGASRSGVDLSQPSIVDYVISGPAVDAGDIVGALTGTLVIPAGQLAASAALATVENSIGQNDRPFTVTYSNLVNGRLSGSTNGIRAVEGTILDDDAMVQIGLFLPDTSEGGSLTLLATRTGGDRTQDTTVNYTISGSAANPGDMSTPLTGTIVIPVGQGAATLTIDTVQDAIAEADESFQVFISNPVNGSIRGAGVTGKIFDDDNLPEVSIFNFAPSLTEGEPFAFFVGRSLARAEARRNEPTTVSYVISGTAADAGDISTPLTGTITIPAGLASTTFIVNTVEDLETEPDETFSITIFDPVNGTIGAFGTASATISNDDFGPNRPPVAVDDSFAVNEDATLTVTGRGLLGNDTDPDGNPVTAVLVAGPANGMLSLSTSGSFTYTPAANFNGADSFTYRANDGTDSSNVATVTIAVAPVNDAPIAATNFYFTDEDRPLIIAAPDGLLVNDTDPEGDPLTAALLGAASNGSVAVNADGSFIFVPDANFHGEAVFTYAARDGTLASGPAEVRIAVIPVNDAPVARDNSYVVDEDAVLTILSASGVLAGDTDADGDALSAALVAGPSNGALQLSANGSFTYTPRAGFNGVDTFAYRASDGLGGSDLAAVSITVRSVNDAPIAIGDDYSIAEDGVLTIAAAAGVLANDADADADPLTAQVETGPRQGTLALGADGSFVYTPDANFFGNDSFTYRANDGATASGVATVNITVAPVEDRPVPVDDVFTFAEGEDLFVPNPGIFANDIDIDGLGFLGLFNEFPQHGILFGTIPGELPLVFFSEGGFRYQPSASFNGTDTFKYRLAAGIGFATVTIIVTPVNDAPLADDDSYTVAEDGVLTVGAATGVLNGDTDADIGDVLRAVLVAGPTNGTLTLNQDGSFTYTPNAGFSGSDGFTYRANDGTTDSNTATVAITVKEIPPPVVSIAIAPASAEEGAALVLTATRTGEDLSQPTTVSYAITGAAGDPRDITTPLTGTITIAAGETRATLDIATIEDTVVEGDEAFTVTISDPSNGTLGQATAVATILNDDREPPVVSVSIVPGTANEGAPFTMLVERTGDLSAASTVTYTLTGTAANAGDIASPLSGTITFAAGQFARTVAVNTVNDLIVEPDEAFTVTLSAPVNATLGNASADATILNDDALPELSVAFDNPSVAEGDPLFLRVTRTGALNQQTSVDLALSGPAATPGDITGPLNRTITFAPGQQEILLQIDTVENPFAEPNEGLIAKLSNPVNGAILIGTAVAAIENDDTLQTQLQAFNTFPTAAEGDIIALVVNRIGDVSSEATVAYNIFGPAGNINDFATLTGTLTFAAGAASTSVLLLSVEDAVVEQNENFTVIVGSSEPDLFTPAQVTGLIVNDDFPVIISLTPPSTQEGGTYELRATRSGDVLQSLALDYVIQGQAANAGDIATPLTGKLRFDPGQSTATVTIATVEDFQVEPNETFQVVVTGPAGVPVVGAANGIIVNDDALPSISFENSVSSISEGGALTLNFTRTGNLSDESRVSYTLSGAASGPADISTPRTGTLVFAPGEAGAALVISTIEDTFIEPNETLTITLSNPVNATLTSFSRSLTINNDDFPVIISLTPPSTQEGGAFELRASRSGDMSQTMALVYAIQGQAANAGDIATPLTGDLRFDPGQSTATITISTVEDFLVESNETFNVAVSGPAGVTINGAANGIIVNDDAPPSIWLSATAPEVSEGDVLTVIAWRAGLDLSRATSVAYTISGYGTIGPRSGSLTFAPNETEAILTIATIDDNVADEPGRHRILDVTIASPVNGTIMAGSTSITVLEDEVLPVVTVALDQDFHNEGDSFALTANRTGSLDQAMTFNYTITGSAANASDISTPLTGVIRFDVGEETARLEIQSRDDTVREGHETFAVRLRPATGTLFSTTDSRLVATGGILNDDGANGLPRVSISLEPEFVDPAAIPQPRGVEEGDAFILTATRVGGLLAEATTVTYVIAGVNGGDISHDISTPLTGTLRFDPFEGTTTLRIDTIDDGVTDSVSTILEEFTVTILAGENARIGNGEERGFIRDNDDATYFVTLDRPGAAEGDSFVLTARREGNFSEADVPYTIGGAANAADFITPRTGLIRFAAGSTTATLQITTSEDAAVEPDENFVFQLGPDDTSDRVRPNVVQGTIANDDGTISQPRVSISVSPEEAEEGTVFILTATRIGGDLSQQTSVTYEIVGPAADPSNFATPLAGTIAFAPGEHTVILPLATIDDRVVEEDSLRFAVGISDPVNGVIDAGSVHATISDNDANGGSGGGIVGGDDSETNFGTPAADRIVALKGDDVVHAGSGDDLIQASLRDVRDFGGDGDDFYDGGAGNDTVDYAVLPGGATITLTDAGGTATGPGVGNDGFLSIENVIGTQGSDEIRGNSAANIIDGGSGDDLLDGGAGADTFVFQPRFGNDRIEGFDADPANGQDLLDLRAFGILPAEYANRVRIAGTDHGTLVTIDDDPDTSIRLIDVPTGTVGIDDFRLF